MSDDTLRRAIRCTLLGLALCLAALLVSGLWLVWHYAPIGDVAWNSTWETIGDRVYRLSLARNMHRWISGLAMVVTVALVVELVLLTVRKRKAAPVALGLPTMLGALAASITGYLLPWDQLALFRRHRRHEHAGLRPHPRR